MQKELILQERRHHKYGISVEVQCHLVQEQTDELQGQESGLGGSDWYKFQGVPAKGCRNVSERCIFYKEPRGDGPMDEWSDCSISRLYLVNIEVSMWVVLEELVEINYYFWA